MKNTKKAYLRLYKKGKLNSDELLGLLALDEQTDRLIYFLSNPLDPKYVLI